MFRTTHDAIAENELAMSEAVRSILERNLQAVRQQIAGACARAGRAADSVTLVVVTKKVSPRIASVLHELGQRDLGESRPQELWKKHAVLSDDVCWHLIGHLQTNKVRRTLPMVRMVHSLDRPSLAEALSAESVRLGRGVTVTLQVNLTGEEAKHGFGADELRDAYPRLLELPGLEIVGLMAMARFEADPEKCRPTFAQLRELAGQLRSAAPAGPELRVLSMGMSGDFEIAIEEGATHVRIGSVLFEGLEDPVE